MSAVDVWLSKELKQSEMEQFLATYFAITRNTILLTDEITGAENIAGINILGVIKHINGEFPIHLAIYIYFEPEGIGNEGEIAIAISRMFGCRVLIISEDVNPYVWILYDNDGRKMRVLLDDVKLDDHEEMQIIKYCDSDRE